MDSIKSKTERATNVMAAAIDKNECPETDFANAKLKLVESLESYSKKHRNITNKILDELDTLSESFGNLAELHRSRLSEMPNDKKEDQALSVNFLAYLQGNFKVIRDELCKGYAKQMEYIISEISETKSTLSRNVRKPVDSLENMTTMFFQLQKGMEKRNQLIQRRQYSAFYLMNQNVSNFYSSNHRIYTAINQISEIEEMCQRHSLHDINYVGRSISEVLSDENRKLTELPRAIEGVINILYDKYYESEGIFRTTASQIVVDELYHRLSVSPLDDYSCDVLASVLKRYVREIPGMLFNNSVSRDIFTEYSRFENPKDKINNLANLFSSNTIQDEKKTLFKHIMRLCHKISKFSSVNLMNESNLAVCWTPTMFAIENYELPDYLKMVQFFISENNIQIGHTTPRVRTNTNYDHKSADTTNSVTTHLSSVEVSHNPSNSTPIDQSLTTDDLRFSEQQFMFSQPQPYHTTKTQTNPQQKMETQSQRDPVSRYPMMIPQRPIIPSTNASRSGPVPIGNSRQKFLKQRQGVGFLNASAPDE
ncbi:Rho-GAP domain-containing protein [Entamoeba marina]